MPVRWPAKQTKHRNKKVERGGEKFDSIREYKRYNELHLLFVSGNIDNLKRQVPFVLAPSVKLLGEKEAPLVRNYTGNLQAYNLYLQGRFFWNTLIHINTKFLD